MIMKLLYLKLLLFIGINVFSQNKNGNLLLLKIDKKQNLKIDKYETSYFVIELDSNYLPINEDETSKIVLFKDFTDNHLFSCINKDSIRLKTFLADEKFDHDRHKGLHNAKLIENNLASMKKLLELNVKSSLYDQRIKISYILMNCNYCVGSIAKYDKEFIGYNGKVILVIDELSIIKEYEIPKGSTYEIIKSIDFNHFLY